MNTNVEELNGRLSRRFGLLQSTALNMLNMIGIGPFITIPALMSAVNGGGPQCMLGWLLALLVVLPDGLVWAELGASMPNSGGTYSYLREGFGREKWGRLMAFLFIWQFMISGPMEIGSGFVGMRQYLTFLFSDLSPAATNLIIIALGILLLILLYRRIAAVGKVTVALWIGTLVTVGAIIVGGVRSFDSRMAFTLPPRAFHFSLGFLTGLGAAARIGVYDYLGYNDVCYVGEEVKDPGRVIPQSIIISLFSVAVIYVAMNLSIISVVPWQTFVPVPPEGPAPVASLFIQKIWGPKVAKLFTFFVLWTSFACMFALVLGYSRIPYAAARDGCFFRAFARLHPTKSFPHISLLLIIALAMAFTFLDLSTLIDALLTTRILVQFIGQSIAVILLRRSRPTLQRPFRLWLYPLPALLALIGWLFLFCTTPSKLQLGAFVILLSGILFFLVWSWQTKAWPFCSTGIAVDPTL